MATFHLYDGSVCLEFDEAKHLYLVDGEPVTSVTGILGVINKEALVPWAAKMTAEYWLSAIKPGQSYDEIDIERFYDDSKRAHKQFSKSAASIGTIVHDYAERVAKGESPALPVNKEALKGCQAFDKWRDENEVEFIESEFKIYSRQHKFAGTCDLDCRISGKRTLADYKTSSGIYPEMYLQTAGYASARMEELDIKYDQRAIVLFHKQTGKFTVGYRNMENDMENDWAGFKGCIDLSKSLKNLKAA